jgi:hypothetical protein
LGHIISEQGVATNKAKIAAVQNWPEPSNVTQLRSFLGLTGYYRRFIKDYGSTCRPLFNCLKKDGFLWGDEQLSAFNKLKQLLTQAPVLKLPDFSAPFVLETDASGYGLGAVLMQSGRPISFFSKAIGPKAAAMSTYDKEALAIIEALKKWKHYFAASSLIIRTDQQSLKYIQDQKLTEGIQHKLLCKLLRYNYTVEYKKGKSNTVVDALSRVKPQISALVSSAAVPVWITEVKASYDNDTKCQELITKLAITGTADTHYTFHHGLLRYDNRIIIGNNTDLRNKLIIALHASELRGHSGSRATYHRMKMLFYWPAMKQHIITFIQQCPVCQLNKPEHSPYPGLLQPLPVPEFAWTHVSMDFIEGLPLSDNKDVIFLWWIGSQSMHIFFH